MAKYNNATTEYDNTVEPSKKKGGLLSGLKSSLSSALNTISGGAFSKLNKLTSKFKGFDLSSFVNKLGNKLSGMLKSYLDNAISMLKDMMSDALTQLKNAGKNFALNILEQFVNDIKASMYIEDAVFVQTIKALYYAGADLAYNNHYIRENALTRDWNYTLKFLDEQYNIDYSLEYNKLETDLKKAAQSGSYKNIKYIFGEMMDNRNNVNTQIASTEASIAALVYDNASQKALIKTKSTLTNNRTKYDKFFVKYTAMLISYSYSSLSASKLKDLIKSTNGIVLPRYFGDTDNKYNKSYKFKEGDIKRMMPTFTQHKLTNTDKATMEDLNDQQEAAEEEADELREDAKFTENNANNWLNEAKTKGSDVNKWLTKGGKSAQDAFDKSIAYAKTQSKLETFRANYKDKQSSQNKALAFTALKKGSGAVVKDTRARFHKNYDGSSVKYRPSASDVLNNVFGDENEYITLRNNNIKSIYILLSSKAIYGNDCMVNELFYKRCKQKTMNTLRSSFDKAKGLLGASSIVQTLYDLSDIVEGSAYNYTKKVEKFLYDPKTNTELVGGVFSGDFSGFNSLQFDAERNQVTLPTIDESTGTIVNTTDLTEAAKNPKTFQAPTSTSTVSNEKTEEEITQKMDSDVKAKKKILDVSRYADKIPIGTKRDMLVKYFTKFYDSLIKRNISSSIAQKCLSNLIYKIVGRANITSTGQIEGLFVNATSNTLTNNLKVFVSIDSLDLTNDYLGLDNYDKATAKEIKDIFSLNIYALSMEMKSTSFSKATFVYDNEYMQTLARQKYEKELAQLARMDQKKDKVAFYAQKDVMTKTYDGFDRAGILGFDERNSFKVKYTNIETGDWNSICVGSEGTFFGGSDASKNNGVMYLDDSAGVIKKTSKTSGTWDIFKKCDTIFFRESCGDVYIWNDGTKDLDKVISKEGYKYNFIEFTNYGFIFAIGTNNNGIKMYKNRSFTNITTSGSNFKYFFDKNKLFFYTDEGNSPIIAIDITDGSFSKTTETSGSYVSPVKFTVAHKVTITITETDPETQLTTTSTDMQTLYRHHILFGKKNSNSVFDLVNESEDKDLYEDSKWTTSTYLNSKIDRSVYLAKCGNTIKCISVDSGTEGSKFDSINIVPETSKSYTASAEAGDTVSISSAIGSGLNQEYKSIENSSDYSHASHFYCINDNLFFITIEKLQDNTEKITSYVHKKDSNSINKLTGVVNPKSTSFYSPYFNNQELIWAKDNITNNLYYCNTNGSLKAIFNQDKYKISGWEYLYINRKYAQIYNSKANLGVLLYNNDTNSLIITNINSGKWKVLEGIKHYYAFSQSGTNQGVKYSNKGNFNFTNITEQKIDHYDFSAFYTDFDKKRVYCAANRKDCILNVNAINYDINEYIYVNNVYQLYKNIEKSNDNQTEALLNDIDNKLSGIDESKITTLSQNEIKVGPISGKEYFVKDETTGNLVSVGKNLTEFSSDETYYTDKSKDSSGNNVTTSYNSITSSEREAGPVSGKEYFTKDSDGNIISLGTDLSTFDSNTEYFTKQTSYSSSIESNGFTSLSAVEIANGPNLNTEYFVKDETTSELISVGNISKFDENQSYYIKESDYETKYEPVNSSEIGVGPTENIEYFVKNNGNNSKTSNEMVSVGNELTSFDPITSYYKETNPIPGVPIISYIKLTNEEISVGPVSQVEYFNKTSNGEFVSIGNGQEEVKTFDSNKVYYKSEENRTIDPAYSSDMRLLTIEEKNEGPISNTNYYIRNTDETTQSIYYELVGIGNDTLTDFNLSINYYIVENKAIINSTNMSTSDILNEIKSTWDPYMEDLDEIEKSSPFYTDLVTTSLANQEFNIDDPNVVNGIQLDLILGDEGRHSKAYLLLEDEQKTYKISNVNETYSNLTPGTKNWNIINEYSSVDFLNSDETDLETIPKNN